MKEQDEQDEAAQHSDEDEIPNPADKQRPKTRGKKKAGPKAQDDHADLETRLKRNSLSKPKQKETQSNQKAPTKEIPKAASARKTKSRAFDETADLKLRYAEMETERQNQKQRKDNTQYKANKSKAKQQKEAKNLATKSESSPTALPKSATQEKERQKRPANQSPKKTSRK